MNQAEIRRIIFGDERKPGTHKNHFPVNKRRARQRLIEALSKPQASVTYDDEHRTTYREGNDV